MATQPQVAGETPANNETPVEEPKTVVEHMANRRVFFATFRDPSPEELEADPESGPVLVQTAVDAASAYLNTLADTLSDFGDYPLAAPGIDAEGNFDAEVYTEDMGVMVSKLKNKTKVKAIVVCPIPTLDSILSDAAGTQWAEKILLKEMNHVAVRALREAEDVSTVVDQMPVNRLGYIEAGAADAGIIESFNELYKPVNATLATKFPIWAKARLIKSELKKAMESKGYAAEFYAALEDYKGQSLFAIAIGLAQSAAKRKGLDPAIFDRWAATRDQKVYDASAPEEDEDADEFNVEALTESLLAVPAGEEEVAAPTTENAAEPGESGTTTEDQSGEAEQPVTEQPEGEAESGTVEEEPTEENTAPDQPAEPETPAA